MKKILSILGTITLIGTSTTSLVACKPQYSEEQLKELKEENKININGNTLEWMVSQEKPFDKVDNKYYFVIWRGVKGHDWKIAKFKHTELKGKVIDMYDKYYTLELRKRTNYPFYFILLVRHIPFSDPIPWEDDNNGTYFKNVYRWDDNSEPNMPVIDSKTGEINEINKEVKEVEVKEDK